MSDQKLQDLFAQLSLINDCRHENKRQVVRRHKNGSVHSVSQCEFCGIQVGSASKWSDACESLDDFDDALLRHFDAQKSSIIKAIAEEKRKIRSEWFDSYDEYLTSPEWKSLREKVMRRSGGVCECCKSAPSEAVHHLTYLRVGMEALFDLVAVCHECHKALHVRHNPGWGKQ